MAARDANAEIAASLTMDEIPVKLRCAACNKLANNAFRTPCCDQSICEDCQASLPEACPVCLHEPVKADDCRPNKALRTTIKIFLKKKVMERESVRKKEMLEKAAVTPAAPTASETPAPQNPQALALAATEVLPEDDDASQDTQDQHQAPRLSKATPDLPTEAQKDIPQMSIESPGVEMLRRDSTQTAGDGSNGQEKSDDNGKASDKQQLSGQNEQWASTNGLGQGMNSGRFGFDGTNSFPNMGFNEFNPMMQFLPSGMPNPMMSSFPNMMGMTGMGMDPMTMSQGMYGGFGGQGMGMNGMNMGMGFDAGQGAFGGFNGQPPAWNAGQNKYNQNAYGGHAGMSGGADFGANAGYGGYNIPPHQGNFNQMNHHQYPNNDFHHGHHSQSFQNRGRGRGRGYQYAGRGRGGYNQVSQGNNQTNYEQFHQQVPQQITRRGSPQYGERQEQPAQSQQGKANDGDQEDAKLQDSADGLKAEEQLNKDLAPGDADDKVETAKPPSPNEEAAVPTELVVTGTEAPAHSETQLDTVKEEAKPAPIETFISREPSKSDVTFVGNESAHPVTMMPPPSAVIPTGPAADHQSLDMTPRGRGSGRGYLRGVPFRAMSQGRGSGYIPNNSIPHSQATVSVAKPSMSPVEPKGLGVEGAPKAPKALREAQPNTTIRGFSIAGRASASAQVRPNDNTSLKSPSRERSRSPSRHQPSHHRHHRHRSSSPSDENEREKRRERHHRHSRKHEDENYDSHDFKPPHTRDVSADSSTKRSSHRSRRDYEKSRDGERSSHRSHRHRERSRDREDEHRSGKNRSPSPEFTINGASRANGTRRKSTSNYYKSKNEEPVQTTRKRRSDDEEHHEDHRRDRKRSRRDYEEIVEEKSNGHRSRPSKREDKESRSNHDRPPRAQEKPVEEEPEKPTSPPRGPKIDQHALEREARNAERVARENQRRALQQGGSSTAGKGGKANVKGRRMSYKYEDDESIEARTLRVESEREALRFR